jgi:CHAT domain-containing protein/tetratricopeptide (TPR) repeat protein
MPDFCYDLLEQLHVQGTEDGFADEIIQSFNSQLALLPSPQKAIIVEELCLEAEQRIWYSPRQSRALGQLAWLIAHQSSSEALQAYSKLILGIIHNFLGQFSEALSLLIAAQDFFEKQQPQSYRTSRCYSEIGLSYLSQSKFQTAQVALNCAQQIASVMSDEMQIARCEQTLGLLYLVQTQYQTAITHFDRAWQLFIQTHHPTEAALTCLHLADTWLYIEPKTAQGYLDQARATPALIGSPVHLARCDLVQGFIYVRLNKYEASITVYRRAWAVFTQENMLFFAARCDVDRGIAHYRLNQYDVALRGYHRARTVFLELGLTGQVNACDLNIANVYYDLNRTDEALTIYQRVAQAAETEGRLLRAGRCYNNMGACYQQLGRYDRAIDLHQRAEQIFCAVNDLFMTAIVLENLAGSYRDLGRYPQALEYYQAAQKIFEKNDLVLHLAFCDMQIATLYLVLNQPNMAQERLLKARQLYQNKGMTAYQAICNRRLATTAYTQKNYAEAERMLSEASQFFTALQMPVDLALCQLLTGKIILATQKPKAARPYFQQAYDVLVLSLPEPASAAIEGLAECAVQQGELQTALEHYISAANLVSRTRSFLTTERLSGEFFNQKQSVFHKAIKLALQMGAPEQALTLIQAGKAQNLFTFQNLWHLHKQQNDPYIILLLEQTADLRRQLTALRPGVQSVDNAEPLPSAVLKKLAELSLDYEEKIEQLRLALPTSQTSIAPFSLAELREQANGRFGDNWLCLEYFINEADLIIFCVDPYQLQTHTRQLTKDERWLLTQCTQTDADRRRLVYQGQIRGFVVPGNPGKTYLQRLSQILLPPEILSCSTWDMLIVAPHNLLHNLPFHALLLENEMALLEKGPIAYIPSLHLLQHLWQHPQTKPESHATLICGVEDFGSRALPLPYANDEVQMVAELNETSHTLYQAEATLVHINRLNDNGHLADYDTLHFATHAITEPTAPMLSRILLSDDDLTVTDILGLKLSAQLIILSTCTSAIGQIAPGDEMMTLARAFFYAGTRSVISSLWAVEDKTTVALMANFYRAYQTGMSAAQALRQAQLSLKNDGQSAYQWASFVTIGCP